MKDYAEHTRQHFLRRTREWKLEQAKKTLGPRWVLHPANRVQRMPVRRGVLG